MTLQEAIDFSISPPPLGIEVIINISMHDDEGNVLVGAANGLSDMFRRDLPLLNLGIATIGGGGATLTTGPRPVPGFSTRGLGPANGVVANLGPIPIDFSVRRDPGNRWLALIGRGGPSVQIEIETLSAAAPAGMRTGGIKLEVAEDGALLRAVGPSLQNPASRASYTATMIVFERPS